MSVQNSSSLTVQEAHKILKIFDCLKIDSSEDTPDKNSIRQALLLVTELSDNQILGVCADTAEQGIEALKTYATALGYEVNKDLATIDGSVYIKFNPQTNLCYLNPYIGEHRGVLVSCQSASEDGINEMYGHLPLDLFTSESS
ncbi:DUF1824 family protein [Coleofasciculus sp. FACHB-1120]|uniref:DUF1824 family protein n=1 Tax=Coleofasciculus sp. FACHB-1120 TaxID=2692783 RepID=UPI001685D0D5|nr:DUF1824 family protein [Coleofasciculus sp. FACHB-1120]MBD2741190.1 DUF1824 family protein [Coleofasciculus sp. FACHB-1120]